MKNIVAFVAILVVVFGGVVWHRHRVRMRALNSGEVFVRDLPSGQTKPLLPSAPVQPATDEIATTATPQPATPSAAPPPESTQAAVTPPSSDSIARNPPNGLAFAGSGKFQLYRQGDITWRLNTQTGEACILFATDAQWRLRRVYNAGCGTRGETTVATGD